MAQIFTIANRKGGVGKTTLATNLAVALSNKGKTLLVDTDDQKSAYNWNKYRQEKLNSISVIDNLGKTLQPLNDEYEFILIDIAGRDSEVFREALLISDKLIVPTQASILDLEILPYIADKVTTAIPMGRTWTTGLSYQFDNPNLEIGWRGRYVQNAGYAPTSRGSDVALNVVRAGYGVNDIFANWKPTGKDDLNVNFSVNNVFDKNYKPHSQRAGANTLSEPGRDVRLSVNYRF